MTAHERDDAYYSLAGPAAALYRQLGACPAEWIDVDGLSALTDLDALASERLAETLIDAGLLDAVDGRFALGSEGHLHARIMADAGEVDEGELNAEGLSRYFAFLKSAARAAERLITPSHRPLWGRETPDELEAQPPFLLDEGDALDWLERQLPNYLAVLRFAYLDRRYALVCDLAHSLWPLWLRRRHPEARHEALTLALASAIALQDESAIGQMLTTLAGGARGSRPVESYEYNRRAANLCQENSDAKGLAQALNGLGKSLLVGGHLDAADQHFRDAEQLRLGLGYVRGVGLSRQGRGLVALARGDADHAADLLISAYEMLLGVGDSYDAALTLAHHAEALCAQGELDRALAELNTASEALTQASSDYGQATVLEIRARIMASVGQSEQAAAALAQALTLFNRTDPHSAARVRDALEASPPSHAEI